MTSIFRFSQNLLVSLAVFSLMSCALPNDGPAQNAAVLETKSSLSGPGEPTEIRVRTLLEWLQEPWGMDFLPDGRLLLTEKPGTMKLVTPGSWSTQEISGLPTVANEGQGGLMDVLVHPDFERNQWVYFSYSVAVGDGFSTRVSRGRLKNGALVDVENLYTARPAYRERRHFGSRLLLDGEHLYITVGDRGNRAAAQSLLSHAGKVIRLTQSGGIPLDNPFVGQANALPEIFSYGHRNPQGIVRHPVTGGIWVSEHGPQGGDEINILRSGANYGWPVITYGINYDDSVITDDSALPGMEQPLHYWVPSIAPSGMAFINSDRYPGWNGNLLVGSLKFQYLNLVFLDNGKVVKEEKLMKIKIFNKFYL